MVFFHHYICIFALFILYAESTDPSAQFCNENSKKTTTQISKNINSLLTKLVQTTSQLGYDAASFGSGQTHVFGLAQCRRDVSTNDCSSCIHNASKEIQKMCPNHVDARIWYEYCLLRYNTVNFISKLDTGYGMVYDSVEHVTDPKTFNVALRALMNRIKMLVGVPGSKGVAKGKTKLTDNVTLYALAQCTQDLSQLSCRQCLAIALRNSGTLCKNKKGCKVIFSSCYFRYELYPFFFPLDKKLGLKSSSITNYLSVVTKP